jgi:hypothetical protein
MNAWAQEIEGDLKWREEELAALKKLCVSSSDGSVERRGMLRALCALLYAHYEGFYKFCWDYLVDHITSTKIKRSDLSRQFYSLSAKKDISRLISRAGGDLLLCNSREIDSISSAPANFERLETKSNLWPNVARENNELIGFRCDVLDEASVRLKLIVGRRNEIAHGKKLVIKDIEEYLLYEDAAFLAMHEVATSLIECIEKKSYQRRRVRVTKRRKFDGMTGRARLKSARRH